MSEKKLKLLTKHPSTYLAICALFIVGGFANNGLFSFYPAIPFAVFAGFLLRKMPITKSIPIILTTVILSFLVGFDQNSNKLLYPYIGSEVELRHGWGFCQFSDSNVYSLVSPDSAPFTIEHEASQPEFYKKKVELFENKRILTIKEVAVSHPDLFTTLSPVLVDKEGVKYQLLERELFEQIEKGTVQSKTLVGASSVQSHWTRYLGNLMHWAIFPMLLFSMVSSLFFR